VAEEFDSFKVSVEQNDWEAAHRHHLGFHTELIDAIGLPALSLVMRPMHYIISLSSIPPEPDEPTLWEVDVHQSILAALEAGDKDAMAQAVAAHYESLRLAPYQTLRKTRIRDAVLVETLKDAVHRATL
jgi:DNA-binding GntR family transcriptional regulator